MDFKALFPDFKKRAVTLSYDDGVKQDIPFLSCINKYGLKCTFNINTGLSRQEKYRNGIDCSILSFPHDLSIYKGHEIATHSFSHPHLEDLTICEQYNDYKKDIENLERWLGQKIIGSAYPFGTYNDETLQVLKDLGIKYARTIRSTYAFHRPYDFLLWHPTVHQGDEKLFETLDRFFKCEAELPVFYLWGHTYELSLYNTFDVIEKLCKIVSEHQDVWRATNQDIYEYYKALDLVVYKNGKITNFSRRTIYCLIDGEETLLLPRQTVEI